MADKNDTLRQIMSGTVDVPALFALRTQAAEIEELKSEGCSYKKIHAVMVERKIINCSYTSFISALRRIKKEASPKKEEPKKVKEWGAGKTDEYREMGAATLDEYEEIYGHD